MSRRISKQDLKHDGFVEWTGHATEWIQRKFMPLAVAVAVIAVAVVGTVFYQQSRARSQNEAAQLLHQVTATYTGGAYSECLISADELLDRFGGSESGKAALYYAGASHLALGENDQAVEKLRAYLDTDPSGLYVGSSRAGLALAYEGRGDLVEAAEAFRSLRGDSPEGTPLHTQACFGESRALEGLGQIPQAIEVLQPLVKSSDFQARQEAEARISVLEARQGGPAS